MDTVTGPGACVECRGRLGPYVLGQLPDDERDALQAHLRTSPACAAEYEQLRTVAAALPLVDPGALGEPVPMPSATLGARIEERIRAERRAEGRRRRRLAVRVAVAAAVAAVLVVVGAVSLRDDQRTVDRRLVAVGPAAVSADARLVERPWGTSVTIDANGLSPGITYGAWLERADGSRVPAGTFRAETDRVVVTLAAALPLEEGRAVGVSTLDGTDVLRAPLG